MNIRIDENWAITSDEYNVILQQRFVNKKEDSKNFGEEYWTNSGFYRTLEDALNGYLTKKIRQSNATTLQEIAQEIKETRKLFAQIARGE